LIIWNVFSRTKKNDDREDNDDGEEVPTKKDLEGNMIKSISSLGRRIVMEVDMYLGSLKPEELIDWISEVNAFFDFDGIEGP
jgi:hypothetical protein